MNFALPRAILRNVANIPSHVQEWRKCNFQLIDAGKKNPLLQIKSISAVRSVSILRETLLFRWRIFRCHHCRQCHVWAEFLIKLRSPLAPINESGLCFCFARKFLKRITRHFLSRDWHIFDDRGGDWRLFASRGTQFIAIAVRRPQIALIAEKVCQSQVGLKFEVEFDGLSRRYLGCGVIQMVVKITHAGEWARVGK